MTHFFLVFTRGAIGTVERRHVGRLMTALFGVSFRFDTLAATVIGGLSFVRAVA
uniref:hypothetical protein n=1 Tax=Sphingomonas populi TaxID=2484750 RepID=UPI0013EEAB83|nr:hypothetical protein [Sphingomonas populi]